MRGPIHVLIDQPAAAEAALRVGVRVIQVRLASGVSDRVAYALTVDVVARCRLHDAVCLVNDRVAVALAAGADGVHLGRDDLPVAVARTILPPPAIIGATVRDPTAARAAVRAGASYLGVGPAFLSPTKPQLPVIGTAGIAAVVAACGDTPVIAIGGITPDRVADVRRTGAHGVAVISAAGQASALIAAWDAGGAWPVPGGADAVRTPPVPGGRGAA